MPELPEVETVRRILLPQLAGRAIAGLAVYNAQVIAHPDREAFASGVKGAVISDLRRRGKYLLVDLDNGCTIAVHLRMTGRLLAVPPDYPEQKHTHLAFQLEGGWELRFLDVRRFGRLWLLSPGEPDAVTGMHKLGIEPFDRKLTAAYLEEKLGRRRITVKQGLLDQAVVAGIGNIYADEILYGAGVHPEQTASGLSGEQWAALARAIPAVIHGAIQHKNLSPEEYLAGGGEDYQIESFRNVYGRKGQACGRCGALVVRVVIAGRSSHYCPRCQPRGE